MRKLLGWGLLVILCLVLSVGFIIWRSSLQTSRQSAKPVTTPTTIGTLPPIGNTGPDMTPGFCPRQEARLLSGRANREVPEGSWRIAHVYPPDQSTPYPEYLLCGHEKKQTAVPEWAAKAVIVLVVFLISVTFSLLIERRDLLRSASG